MNKTDLTPQEGTGRHMPAACQVEKEVLSMAFMDPEGTMGTCVAAGVSPEWFYSPAYRILWGILQERYEAKKPIEATLIAQELSDRGRLESVGGCAGLHDIQTAAGTTAFLDSYLEELKDKYLRRAIFLTGNSYAEQALAGETHTATLIDQFEQDALRIRQSGTKGNSWNIAEAIVQATKNIENMLTSGGRIAGLSTGFPMLDHMTNGLRGGEFFVVAARPSMGKTSFLLNIAEHIVLNQKRRMAVFSCEMTKEQLAERLIYARSGVSRDTLTECGRDRTKLTRLQEAVKELKKSKLLIDDTGGISISELRAKARRMQRENPDLCAIGIDYLQLMRAHSAQAKTSREREVSEISGGLKALAKELNLPVIVLAQLNRAAENREGKNRGVPFMSDLRDSGSIEQDADFVGLLYRPGYYAQDEEEREARKNEATLRLAKNRNGPTGDIPLYFTPELMQFSPVPEHE